jgi:hypothetical protein
LSTSIEAGEPQHVTDGPVGREAVDAGGMAAGQHRAVVRERQHVDGREIRPGDLDCAVVRLVGREEVQVVHPLRGWRR